MFRRRVFHRFALACLGAIGSLVLALVLGGCGGGGSKVGGAAPPGGVAPGGAFLGKVDGSGPQNPISGSTITFYAIGSSGFGSGNTTLATTTANSFGWWIIGGFDCPSGNPGVQTYITASGGNPGGGSNSAIGMMALTGPCNAITSSIFVMVNGLTTVAAQWALAQFSDSSGKNFGTTSTDSTGLTNAVNLTENDLVTSFLLSGGNPSNTGVPAAFLANIANTCGGSSPDVNCDELERLNTLANVLASCINSNGPSSTQCQQLFCGATRGATFDSSTNTCSTTPKPTDTLAAAHAIVTNPKSNVSTIFSISPPPGLTLFRPALSSAPDGWELALNFRPSDANFSGPFGIALDASGNAWVTNMDSDSVTALDSRGALVGNFNNSSTSGANFSGPRAIALDASGNVWVANTNGNSVSVLIGLADPVKTPLVACLMQSTPSAVCSP